MSVDLFRKAIALAQMNSLDFDAQHPVSKKFVRKCEEMIGFVFPQSYLYFLLNYGFGGVEDIEFCGLVEGKLTEQYFLNAYWLTQETRRQYDIPKDLFIIRDLEDSVVCLLLSKLENGECPVVLWSFSEDVQMQQSKPYLLAQSFGEYYSLCIQEITENY